MNVVALNLAYLVVGVVVVEVIFGRPGIGSYLVLAIQSKDIPAVQSVVLFIAVLYLLINLVVDFAYGFLDPRIRLSWSGAR